MLCTAEMKLRGSMRLMLLQWYAHIEPSSGGPAFFWVFARAVPSARWLVLLGSTISSHCT